MYSVYYCFLCQADIQLANRLVDVFRLDINLPDSNSIDLCIELKKTIPLCLFLDSALLTRKVLSAK